MEDQQVKPSSRRKFDAARRRMEELTSSVDAWNSAGHITLMAKISPDRHSVQFVLVLDEEVPSETWEDTFSDVLHNYRSALDNLAWELSQTSATPPATPGEEKNVYFPLCVTRAKFDKTATDTRWMSGLDSETLRRLRETQPWVSESPRDSVLLILSGVQNVDKHRQTVELLPAADPRSEIRCDLRDKDGNLLDSASITDLARLGRVRDGLPLYKVTTSKKIYSAASTAPNVRLVMSYDSYQTNVLHFIEALDSQVNATLYMMEHGEFPPRPLPNDSFQATTAPAAKKIPGPGQRARFVYRGPTRQ